jgi:hypothetical protein
MKRNTVVLMALAAAVFVVVSLLPAGSGGVARGDGPAPADTLQVNYESGQGYRDLGRFRPGEIIVQFEPNVLPTERSAIVQDPSSTATPVIHRQNR